MPISLHKCDNQFIIYRASSITQVENFATLGLLANTSQCSFADPAERAYINDLNVLQIFMNKASCCTVNASKYKQVFQIQKWEQPHIHYYAVEDGAQR